jgi:anti-sigma factor RsiW
MICSGMRDDCERTRQALSALVDGEATAIEEARALRHAEACADCREFAASAERLSARVRSRPLLEPSRPLMPAPVRRRRAGPPRALLGGSVAAAALGAAVALGSFVAASNQPPTPPPSPAVLKLARLDDDALRQHQQATSRVWRAPKGPDLVRVIDSGSIG